MLTALLLFLSGRWSVSNACSAPLGARSGPQEVAQEAHGSLYDPPQGHGVVAVPSVLKDARGEIHNLQIGGARFNILVSKAGTMRSGDVHRWPQLDMVFSGVVRVTTREAGRDVVRTYSSGDRIVIPSNVPHMFFFVNETVMAEWWLGPFEARYYRPYREKVDSSMQRLATAPPPRRRRLGQRARSRHNVPC